MDNDDWREAMERVEMHEDEMRAEYEQTIATLRKQVEELAGAGDRIARFAEEVERLSVIDDPDAFEALFEKHKDATHRLQGMSWMDALPLMLADWRRALSSIRGDG